MVGVVDYLTPEESRYKTHAYISISYNSTQNPDSKNPKV